MKNCNCKITYVLNEGSTEAVRKLAECILRIGEIENNDKIKKIEKTINSKLIGAIDEISEYNKDCEYCISLMNDEVYPYCINQEKLKKYLDNKK